MEDKKLIVISNNIAPILLPNIFATENSIFEINQGIDLCGQEVILASTSVLFFNGGFLKNGTLSGYISFKHINNHIFAENLLFADDAIVNVPYVRPEWFGAKGNFNPLSQSSQQEGEDDTDAINRAIEVAEQLSIKTVKFNAVNYLVRGIEISRGNIQLEGCGSLLREEQWYIDNGQITGIAEDDSCITRTSTLYLVGQGKSCLTCGQNVVDPICIKDIQFISLENNCNNGIQFVSDFSGPTWPVIIERCYFKNFIYAFYLNSESQDYAIQYLRFHECAFKNNNYCVYFEDIPETVINNLPNGHPNRQCTWNFNFINNKCHDNGHVLRICVQKGICLIEQNNCEGQMGTNSLPTDPNPIHNDENLSSLVLQKAIETNEKSDREYFNKQHVRELTDDLPDNLPEYAIDIEIAQSAHVKISDNHFEGMHIHLAKVIAFYGTNCLVEAMNNNTDGVCLNQDISYFKNVKLDTDLNAIVNNCFIQNRFNIKCKQIPEINTFSFIRERGNLVLNNIPIAKYICKEGHGNPLIIQKTPLGDQMMTLYYHHSNNSCYTSTLLYDSIQLDKSWTYLNIETSICRKASNSLIGFYLEIEYFSNGVIVHDEIPSENFHNISCDEIGFFRLRMLAKLNHEVIESLNCDTIRIHMATYSGDLSMNPSDIMYIGCRIVVLSDTPIELIYNLDDNIQCDINKDSDDKCILSYGDSFFVGKYRIVCVEEGCYLDSSRMRGSVGDNYIISNSQPISSMWTNGSVTFRIVGVKEVISETEVAYYIDRQLPISVDEVFSTKIPVLIGDGVGSLSDRNIVFNNKLAPGSKFYDTDNNCIYVKNNMGNWVLG